MTKLEMTLHWRRLENSMSNLLKDLENTLLQKDIEIAEEYIEHNEFGIGFEHICSVLFQNDIKISNSVYERIEAIGKSMKMNEERWSYLKGLIKND